MCLKPGELPGELYVQGRVHRRRQELEIVCLILYLITIVGRRKMKFYQSDSLIKEWTMTACAFKYVLLTNSSARLRYNLNTSIRRKMH